MKNIYKQGFTVAGLFMMSLMFTTSVVAAETVTSTDFKLKDQNGNVTAQLTTSGEGTPALFFYDKKQVSRISIGLYQGGIPGIVLNDEQGNAAAILRLVQNEGNPVLVLKEDGQDKYIIDTSGIPSPEDTNVLTIILALGAGLLGGLLASHFRQSSSFQNR